MKIQLALTAILFTCLHPLAKAASFDCARATRPVEKAICSNPKLSADDTTMSALYRKDLAQLSSRTIGLLRTDQLQWLAWIQQICQADTAAAAPLTACLQPLYTARNRQLRLAVLRIGGLSFLIRTQFLADEEKEPQHGAPEHPGFGTLQASWPVADTADEEWVAWNRTVEDRLLRMAGPVESAAPRQDPAAPVKAGPKAEWIDSLAESQDVTLDARLKYIETTVSPPSSASPAWATAQRIPTSRGRP